jgi:hypothetical protein
MDCAGILIQWQSLTFCVSYWGKMLLME